MWHAREYEAIARYLLVTAAEGIPSVVIAAESVMEFLVLFQLH